MINLSKIIPCKGIISIFSLAFSLSVEKHNPDHFDILLPFSHSSIPVPFPMLVFIIFVSYSLAFLISVFSYQLLFRLSWPERTMRTFEFILIISLKYLIPVLFVCSLRINGETLIEGSPVTTFLLQICLGFAFLFDWVIYAFRFEENTIIEVKFLRWKYKMPSKQMYKTLIVILLGTMTLGRVHRYITKNKEIQKKENTK